MSEGAPHQPNARKTTHRLRRALAAFERICDLDPSTQEEHLNRIRGEDPQLAEDIVEMLAAERTPLPPVLAALTSEPGSWAASEKEWLRPGFRLGDYEIVRVLGRGGMGEVYAAEDRVRGGSVAIKVLDFQSHSSTAERRFRREIAALRALDIPGIARLQDAGDHVEGDRKLSWFVMDLVHGRPIDEWARGIGRNESRVLRCLIRVAKIAHSAHQRGVIHRDIKPSNILVKEDDEPIVIDFGVAAAMDAGVLGSVGVTVGGPFLGTLPYTSPEYWSGQGVHPDVRGDVYALGILVFELLTGLCPVEVKDLPLAEALVRLRTQAPRRLGQVKRAWRGNLEAIVSKATHADPALRYQSCHELAMDLQRFSVGFPIGASNIGLAESLRLWVRSHRGIAAASAFALVAVFAGTVVAVIGFANAHSLAIELQEEKKETSRKLAGMLEAVSRPSSAAKDRIHMLSCIQEFASDYDSRDGADTNLRIVQSDVEEKLGDAYFELGRLDRAEEMQAKALATRRAARELTNRDPRVARRISVSLVKLGDIRNEEGDFAGAEEKYLEAKSIDEALVGADSADLVALDQLCWGFERTGVLAWRRGDYKQAEELWRRRQETAMTLTERRPESSSSWHNLYCSHSYLARLAGDLREETTSRFHLARCVAVAHELVERFPHDPRFPAILHSAQAEEAAARREAPIIKWTEGETCFAFDAAKRAAEEEPENPSRLRFLAGWHEWIAEDIRRGAMDAKSSSAAVNHLEIAERLVEDALSVANTSCAYRRDLVSIRLRRADLESQAGNPELAGSLRQAAFQDLTRLIGASPTPDVTGELLRLVVDSEDPPRDLVQEVLDAADFRIESHPLQMMRFKLLSRLGRTREAADALERALTALPPSASPKRLEIEQELARLRRRL